MAQFRTTADLLDEVLQKSGEVTNGNSPYEALALTYLNKAHQAIIGGGNIFSLTVDEPWTWARSPNPMVLELQPAITYGSVSVTESDINITFSDAPAVSVQGWHFQLVGTKTVYRIMQHSAGVASAVIDSSMIDASGTYSFRLFKLDYEISPAYIYVDSSNDRIDFEEVVGTQLTASLTHGSYTTSNYIAHVVTRLNAAASATITGSYDSVLKAYTVTSDLAGPVVFNLLGATGTNKKRSALPTLGLDRIDYTSANASATGSYVSRYVVNGISRMIEPFKVFTQSTEQPYVYSTDPVTMELDYPTARTAEFIPSHFTKIAETNEGTITVRFNAYPKTKTKLVIDWVPVPIDLQDNAASYPLVPRKDIDALIHAAVAMVLFDKEDTKWEMTFKLAGSALEAMSKKNRAEQFRTGDNYAQIVPRADLSIKPRKLNYGYTVEGSATQASATETTTRMIEVNLDYSDFQAAALTSTVEARTLPANRSLIALIVKHSIPFSGGSISAVNLSVGILGDLTKFIAVYDVYQAVGPAVQESVLVLYYPAEATGIQVTATAVGANLSALTAGAVTLYFQEAVVSS